MKFDVPDDGAVAITVQVAGRRAIRWMMLTPRTDWDDPRARRLALDEVFGGPFTPSPAKAAIIDRLGDESWPKTTSERMVN